MQTAALDPLKVAISVLSGTCIKDQLAGVFQVPDMPGAVQTFTFEGRHRSSSVSSQGRNEIVFLGRRVPKTPPTFRDWDVVADRPQGRGFFSKFMVTLWAKV